jgi:predicted DNA-binding transcriptional regulator AlpA
LLSPEQAAAYCGISRAHFDQHLRHLLKPLRLGTRVLFDRIRVDEVIERLSSPLAAVPPDGDAMAARLRVKERKASGNPHPIPKEQPT